MIWYWNLRFNHNQMCWRRSQVTYVFCLFRVPAFLLFKSHNIDSFKHVVLWRFTLLHWVLRPGIEEHGKAAYTKEYKAQSRRKKRNWHTVSVVVMRIVVGMRCLKGNVQTVQWVKEALYGVCINIKRVERVMIDRDRIEQQNAYHCKA